MSVRRINFNDIKFQGIRSAAAAPAPVAGRQLHGHYEFALINRSQWLHLKARRAASDAKKLK